LAFAGSLFLAARSSRGSVFWVTLFLWCLGTLIYIERRESEPWWRAIPRGILRETYGFVFAAVCLVIITIVQMVFGVAIGLTVWAFAAALLVAAMIDGVRWLLRRKRPRGLTSE
jgi:hypothetical protein